VEKLSPREYKVDVAAAAEKGRANRELRAALASHFGVPVSSISILRGERSRVKLVSLAGEG
jgi:uncharacterized protein YggU (UPF0235/DUF167 family)